MAGISGDASFSRSFVVSLQPVHAVRQIVVRENKVGPDDPSCHQIQCCDAVWRGRRAIALVLEEEFEQFAHLGIVLDDQDRTVRCGIRHSTIPASARRRCRFSVGAAAPRWKHRPRRRRPSPCPASERTRTRWPSNFPKPLHDRETKAKATASLARGIVELMVLLEDRLKFLVGNADPGVPDLDAQHSLAPAATQQHLAALGVFQGIRQQVADHLLEQTRIAVDRKAARRPRARQALALARDR